MDGLRAHAGSRGRGDGSGDQRHDRRRNSGRHPDLCVKHMGASRGDAVDDEEGVWRCGGFDSVRLWRAGPEGGGRVDHALDSGHAHELDRICRSRKGEPALYDL